MIYGHLTTQLIAWEVSYELLFKLEMPLRHSKSFGAYHGGAARNVDIIRRRQGKARCAGGYRRRQARANAFGRRIPPTGRLARKDPCRSTA